MVSGRGLTRSQKINLFYGRKKDAFLEVPDIERIARCKLDSQIEVDGEMKRPGGMLIVGAKLLLQEIKEDEGQARSL